MKLKTDFLKDFECEIDRKCREIKIIKKRKRMKTFNILIGVMLLFLPSVFYMLNISMLYLFIIMLIVISTIIFVRLPDLLNDEFEEVYL